jgi:hypothetical protein
MAMCWQWESPHACDLWVVLWWMPAQQQLQDKPVVAGDLKLEF